MDTVSGLLGQVLEKSISPSVKLCCSKNGARSRGWGCLGKTPRGSCSTQNRDENADSERNQTHGEKGVDTVLCPERTDSVSREMYILRVVSQAGGAQKSRELGSPAEREKQGDNQTACSDGRTEVGEGRNE